MALETSIKKASCFFCHNHCGILVHVEAGKVKKVEGNREHPVSRGYTCERGRRAVQWLYHPGQLLTPLKRVGNRGEGRWEHVPWEQAVDEIASKLAQLKDRHGAETLVVSEGTYRSDQVWARARFLNLFGNPQNVICPGVICAMNCYSIELALLGSMNYGTDLAQTQCVVLWGINPKETRLLRWVTMMEKIRRKHLKIIAIDPRITESGDYADICLRLRPGTDAALALGWIHVIIREELYDKEFVEKWTYGFDKLAERVGEYGPSRVAQITGLTVDEITQSARLFATTKPACIERGVASDQLGLNSGRVEQARVILRAITGNIDIPGGNPIGGPSLEINGKRFLYDSDLELACECSGEQRKKQIGASRYKINTWPAWELHTPYYEKLRSTPEPQIHRLLISAPLALRQIISEDPYPIRAFICWSSNPMMWASNTSLVKEALIHTNLELSVVLDYWLTPTAQLADYVLPAASWLERPLCTTFEDLTGAVWGGERSIPPIGERHEDYQFWRGLGIRLGQEEYWPWENLEEVARSRIAPLGVSYEEFIQRGCLFPKPGYRKYEKTGFATPTGKLELYSTVFEKLGYDPLPYFEEPPESPIRTPEVFEKYPLILNTGNKFMPLFHSEHRQFGIGLREKHPDPLVHIHPETAQELGIRDGDEVYVETLRGRIKQRAHLSERIPMSVVDAEASWWFPEKPGEIPSLFGALESNANVLTLDDPDLCDPLTGGWCNRALLCKIYKA